MFMLSQSHQAATQEKAFFNLQIWRQIVSSPDIQLVSRCSSGQLQSLYGYGDVMVLDCTPKAHKFEPYQESFKFIKSDNSWVGIRRIVLKTSIRLKRSSNQKR